MLPNMPLQAIRAFVVVTGILFPPFATSPSEPGAQANPPVAPPRPAPSGFFESEGLRIHYETFGAGPPIVLVPGWGSATRRWIDTGWIEALKAKHLVISVEPRGTGKSDKPHRASAYSYSVMSRDVLALLDHLGVDKVDYLGYSMGAFMGAYLLGHHADRFNSMVLAGIGDETEASKNERYAIADALRAPDRARIAPLGAAYRAYAESDPDNDLEALALSALQMWPEGYPRKLGGDGLRLVRIPVLIANGANDPYARSAGTLAAIIPGARLVTIPGTDHFSTWFAPRFHQEVLGFLDQR